MATSSKSRLYDHHALVSGQFNLPSTNFIPILPRVRQLRPWIFVSPRVLVQTPRFRYRIIQVQITRIRQAIPVAGAILYMRTLNVAWSAPGRDCSQHECTLVLQRWSSSHGRHRTSFEMNRESTDRHRPWDVFSRYPSHRS